MAAKARWAVCPVALATGLRPLHWLKSSQRRRGNMQCRAEVAAASAASSSCSAGWLGWCVEQVATKASACWPAGLACPSPDRSSGLAAGRQQGAGATHSTAAGRPAVWTSRPSFLKQTVTNLVDIPTRKASRTPTYLTQPPLPQNSALHAERGAPAQQGKSGRLLTSAAEARARRFHTS